VVVNLLILACLIVIAMLFAGTTGAHLAGLLGRKRWAGFALGVTGVGLGLMAVALIARKRQ
jgi:hypothetical protein